MIVILVIAGSGAYFRDKIMDMFQDDPVYIAAVGPINTTEGRSMVMGIELYVDKVNANGGIDGRKLVLKKFNDRNSSSAAMRIATEITQQNQIALVLGHFSSPASIAAGEVYKKNGIPAITASATVDSVTYENDWYFRVIPHNRIMTDFIANYIKKVLNKGHASVIFDEDIYGSSLASQFERAAKQVGLKIKEKWHFNRNDKKLTDAFRRIVAELRASKDPGAIYFATHETEGVRIITSLKYPGTDYLILGPDSFSLASFIEEFRKYPGERAMPGYYSDGIYAVSPFIPDIAEAGAFEFKNTFKNKYLHDPSWVAACYYDAAQVGVAAIEKAEIQSKDRLRQGRRAVKKALESFNSPDLAIKGVTGRLYFDAVGDVMKECAMGNYWSHKFVPSLSQYQLISTTSSDTVFKAALGSKIIMVNEQPMSKTQIVYTGIDINEISNLDLKRSTCTIDFYLWFRFEKGLRASMIRFLNSVDPIKLERLIMEETEGDITTQAYHVKADFNIDLDFKSYPFDSQEVGIKFRHAFRVRNSLIYVPDTLGLRQYDDDKNDRTNSFTTRAGWRFDSIRFKNIEDDVNQKFNPLSLKKSVNYSQFSAIVRIKRDNLANALKTMIPITVMLILSYMLYSLPGNRIAVSSTVYLSIMLINYSYHNMLLHEIGQGKPLIISSAFLTVYVTATISFFSNFLTFLFDRKKTAAGRRARHLGIVLQTIVLLIFGGLIAYKYYIAL